MADLPTQVTLCVIGSEWWTPSSMLRDAFRGWYAITVVSRPWQFSSLSGTVVLLLAVILRADV